LFKLKLKVAVVRQNAEYMGNSGFWRRPATASTSFELKLSVAVLVTVLITTSLASADPAVAQQPDTPPTDAVVDPVDEQVEAPEKVDVDPTTEDIDISQRLVDIYQATGWFESVDVATDEGIVFISGGVDSDAHRKWAEEVARRTSDVVAVVNRLEVQPGSIWDIQPAVQQLRDLGRQFVSLLPLIIVGFVILLLAYGLAHLLSKLARRIASRRLDSQLLQQVVASIVGVLVFLIGLYIALKVSGLSRLAVTVLGGTGLVGLALGFAFRDIAENYLASILISLNRPFTVGDLIELEGSKGFVRRVTTRGTLLLTLEGNHVQIPNSTVYKAIITNYSSSPNIRREFTVGIGYDDSVSQAQEVIQQVLEHHDAVLADPTPLILVETLGAATVNLKVLFWVDGKRFDPLAVRSAVMRQTKVALAEANISMPDEAREVVFPGGVPVRMIEHAANGAAIETAQADPDADKPEANRAEGNLQNLDRQVQRNAESAEIDQGENLIE